MSNATGPVSHDAWETYVTATEEGTPCFVSFDLEAAQEDLTQTLRHCARVTVALKNPSEEGLPTKEESDRQYGLEDALCAELQKAKVPCRLVARLTHSGQRELVFQTDSGPKFVAVLKAWAEGLKDEDINLEEGEGWEFFDDVVRPGPDEWSWIADRRAVEGLLEAGSDPNRPHVLEYVFVGEEPKLLQVRDALMEKGYDHVSGPEESTLVMSVKCRLDLDAICEHSIQNRDLAEAHEVDCEGWGAAVVAD
jgi:regulator of RNase E activity RraB